MDGGLDTCDLSGARSPWSWGVIGAGIFEYFIGDPWKCLRVLLGYRVSAFWADVGDQDVLGWSGARSPSSCLQHRTTRSLSKISGTGIVDPGLRRVGQARVAWVSQEAVFQCYTPPSGFGMGAGSEKPGQLSNLFCAAERTPTCH